MSCPTEKIHALADGELAADEIEAVQAHLAGCARCQAELHDVIRVVTSGLESYDCTGAGRRIGAFVDDLSIWYVRRSRRRFWKDAADRDKAAAHRTLYECLRTLALLLGPFTPYLADEIWDNVVCSLEPAAPDSVHLADWPAFDAGLIDEDLRSSMAAARRAVGLGLQARTNAKVKVRQPLARAVLCGAGADLAARHAATIAEELNVKTVDTADSPPAGFATATEGTTAVALDTEISEELRAEGLARELVRAVQNLRKKSGLAVADRIYLGIDAAEEAWDALDPHRSWIAGEVLAVSVERGEVSPSDGRAEVAVDGRNVSVSLRRA